MGNRVSGLKDMPTDDTALNGGNAAGIMGDEWHQPISKRLGLLAKACPRSLRPPRTSAHAFIWCIIHGDELVK